MKATAVPLTQPRKALNIVSNSEIFSHLLLVIGRRKGKYLREYKKKRRRLAESFLFS